MYYQKQLPFFLILLLIAISSSAQNDLPTSNGILNGQYLKFDDDTQTTTSGKFKNNLRIGEWIIRDSSDQIVLTRQYHSIYSYTEKRTKPTDVDYELEETTNIKFTTERDSFGLYKLPKVNYTNIIWSKRVWTLLPEVEHGQLYSQEILIRVNQWINNGKIKVYKDDELSAVIDKQEVDLNNKKCIGVTMKKDYFFDKKSGMMMEQIVALTFHVESTKNEEKETFSIFYPTDGRKLLSSFNVSHKSDKIKHYDDLFFFQDYTEVIYNEANAKGIKIEPDFANIKQYQQTSNAIKQLIVSTEHRLWIMD